MDKIMIVFGNIWLMGSLLKEDVFIASLMLGFGIIITLIGLLVESSEVKQ